jgi:phage shock protein PspC (stress-responsive transcriptional regulator)
MSDLLTRVRTKWHLDKDNGWIFGVCAGLANCLHTDPAIVRVGVAVAGLFFPKIVIATYLVAWLILDDRSVINNR